MTEHASDRDRLAALEQQVELLLSRRDGWLVSTLVLSALAIVVAVVAVGFGMRAVDESKDNVVAAGGATAPEAAAAPCQEAAGFPADVRVNEEGTEQVTGATVSLEAGDSFFGPTCASGVPAGTVTLTVENTGRQLHNVTVADQGIDQDVAAGETITVQVEVGAAPQQFVCKYHRTSGMVGALLPAGT